MGSIPADIFWPGFIISLLTIAITASFTILFFAQSGDGPQVIPDYYERSVSFDDVYQARQASRALGWSVDVELHASHGELVVEDADGAPVDGAVGALTYFRPSLAEPVATVDLIEVSDAPGTYHFESVDDLAGSWNLDIALERGDDQFLTRLRQSVPTS